MQQGGAFLQHGSILLSGGQAMLSAVSCQRSAESRRLTADSAPTTLSAMLRRPVTFTEIAEAIVAEWGAELEPLPTARPPDRLTARFADPDWTWRR